MRPFLKWVGGKADQAPNLARGLPSRVVLHEPMVGGGALFWYLAGQGRIERAILSDTSERLVRTWRGVRSQTERVIAEVEARAAAHNAAADREAHFLATRAAPPDGGTDAEVAGWFLYMNRAGFNGLYRLDAFGRCNTSSGKVAHLRFDLDRLRAAGRVLRELGVHIDIGDFSIARRARAGEVVYFDPPYVPVNETARFTGYTAGGFCLSDHRRLVDEAEALVGRGVVVLASNSAVEDARALWRGPGWDVERVGARRAINCDGAGRGEVGELVIRGGFPAMWRGAA